MKEKIVERHPKVDLITRKFRFQIVLLQFSAMAISNK